MSKVFITDTILTDIADSIRVKEGSSETYYPSEMSGAIVNLQGEKHTPIRVNVIQSPHQTISVKVLQENVSVSENDNNLTINPVNSVRLLTTIEAEGEYIAGTITNNNPTVSWGETVTISATPAKEPPYSCFEKSNKSSYDLGDTFKVRVIFRGPLSAGTYNANFDDVDIPHVFENDILDGEEETVDFTHIVNEYDIVNGYISFMLTDTNNKLVLDKKFNKTADIRCHLTTNIVPSSNNTYVEGQYIDYTVTLTNDGNVTLQGVSLYLLVNGDSDRVSDWSNISIQPNETKSYEDRLSLSSSDAELGRITITSNATIGELPDGFDLTVVPGSFSTIVRPYTLMISSFLGTILEGGANPSDNTRSVYSYTFNNENVDWQSCKMGKLFHYDEDSTEGIELLDKGKFLGTYGLWNNQNSHTIPNSVRMALYDNESSSIHNSGHMYFMRREASVGENQQNGRNINNEVITNTLQKYSNYVTYDHPYFLESSWNNDPYDSTLHGTVIFDSYSVWVSFLNSLFSGGSLTLYDFILDNIHFIRLEDNSFYNGNLTMDENYRLACLHLHDSSTGMNCYCITDGIIVVRPRVRPRS